MGTFEILWGIDVVAALIVLYFFAVGLADDSISSRNKNLWTMMIIALSSILLGSIWLRDHQQPAFAITLLFILAIPAALYLAYMLIAVVGSKRLN